MTATTGIAKIALIGQATTNAPTTIPAPTNTESRMA